MKLPSARKVDDPVIAAPDAFSVAGVVVPFPQSMSECHAASLPGSVKLPDTPTASPERIDVGVVAAKVTVGVTLATVTVCIEFFCQPKASVTVSVAVKSPWSWKSWYATLPESAAVAEVPE